MNPTEPRHRNPARRPRLSDTDVTELLNLGYADALEEGRRADLKAGHLLTVFGVLVAAVAAVASRGGLPLGSTVVLWVSAAPIAAAFIRLLLAIRPNLDGHPLARLATVTPAEVLRTFETEYESGTYYRADQLQAHARAVIRKYRAIRTAVLLVLLGVFGVAVAVLLATGTR